MNKLMNKVRNNKKGFTLIELIVVIAILGILVLLAAPRFLGYTKDAEVATMQADAKVLSNAALVYNIENEGKWPTPNVNMNGNTFIFRIGGEPVEVMFLDPKAFKDHVQTLKGEFSDYLLVTAEATITIATDEGNVVETLQEGDIVFFGNDKKGVEDSKGNRHYAVNIKFPKADSGE